jgi:hypothetical protein
MPILIKETKIANLTMGESEKDRIIVKGTKKIPMILFIRKTTKM